MALTAYMLSEAVSTIRNGGNIGKIVPYEFATDNINECMSEMGYMIMMESNEMAEAFVTTDEILAEAAIGNPGVMETLTESVFTKIKDGVKKFFEKIISMVKGIIDKLKAYFYKMTGKTSKWLTVMKPKIQAVKSNQTGYEKVTAETYAYDENYIINGMNEAVKGLADDWEKTTAPVVTGSKETPKTIQDLASSIKSSRDTATSGYEKPGTSDENPASAVGSKDSTLTGLEKETKQITDALDKYMKDFPKKVAGVMGAGNATTLDAVWASCAKKARGGKTEKTTITIGNNTDKMINTLEGMSDAVTKMKDTYEAHLKKLVEFKESLDANDFTVDDNAKVPGNIMTAVRNKLSAQYKFITDITSKVEQAMNSAKSQNLALLQEMSTSYMSSLTTFAAYKAKKS